MNFFKRYKDYITGRALANNEDVFEKAKINVLFSITNVFIVAQIPYVIVSLSFPIFFLFMGLLQWVGFIFTLIAIRKYSGSYIAAIVFVVNFCVQDLVHFFLNSGNLASPVGMIFFIMGIIITFFLLGNKWGWIITGFIVAMLITGMYNMDTDYSLFRVPEKYADPPVTSGIGIMASIPILLIVYIVNRFVSAKQKAEEIIRNQKSTLEITNLELEQQRRDVTASISYAKRIQLAVLPQREAILRNIPLNFIFYQPRDIVSGDFFWFHEIDRDNYIFVCADCTGHGVPGALMTVVGSSSLNQIIVENKIISPSKILSELDLRISNLLRQNKEHEHIVQDGMDLSLIKVNKASKELIFASAKRPLIYISNKQLQEYKGSKFSLGGAQSSDKHFEEISINYKEDDVIYLFTDGIVDQFGGPNNKKFTSAKFKELLLSIQGADMPEQKNRIEKVITNWIGKNEQTDDICVIGIKF